MITSKERDYPRAGKTGKRCFPETGDEKTREELWYNHNELKTTDPVIAVFPEMSWREIITPESLQCECDEARDGMVPACKAVPCQCDRR